MALTTEQVIERLLETAGGQVVACNVLAGVQNNLVDAAWVAEVLASMGEIGSDADYAGVGGFLGVLDDLRTRPSTVTASGLPDIRLGGTDAPSPFEVEVSCILPAWRAGTLMSREDRRRLAREGLALPRSEADPLATTMVNEWQSRPAGARMVRIDPAATVGRPDDVIWFTRRSVFDDALALMPTNVRAQRARDLLGLVHHQEGAMLAAMHFDPPTLSACPSARPTFADAGSHARFKTWPDDEVARKDPSWGRTVDLHALDADAASVDGCPERIAKSTRGDSLANGGTFEFELLGAVQTSANQGDATDVTFFRRLSKGRSAVEIGAELKALIDNSEQRHVETAHAIRSQHC